MGKKREQPQEDEGGPSAPFWMVTYSDMVTLLLTFFVMLMAMAGWGFLKKFFWIQCWDFNLKVNSVQNRS